MLIRGVIPSRIISTLRFNNGIRIYYSTGSESNADGLAGSDTLKQSDSTLETTCDPVIEAMISKTRGKKRKPSKASFVVLNPTQAGLLRKRHIPSEFSKKNGEKLSILEGIELDKDMPSTKIATRDNDIGDKSETSKILNEIENSRKRLLVFASTASQGEAAKSINYQKPTVKKMSQERYDQLKYLLDTGYTVPQLRAYTKKYYNDSNNKLVKHDLIKKVLNDYWGCIVTKNVKEADDVIIERIIDISTRDMYLLLLTNNGKIMHNLARIGATLAVVLDENKIIVRGTSAIIKYVEVSLNKILQNVVTETMPISDIIQFHTAKGAKLMTYDETRDLTGLIQRVSGAFFEKVPSENNQDSIDYTLASLGRKRIEDAKKLFLWAMNYECQLQEKFGNCTDPSLIYKNYPYTSNECLDWINRSKEWYRVQSVQAVNTIPDEPNTDTRLHLENETIETYRNFLNGQESSDLNTKMMKLSSKLLQNKTNSITLGQILRENNVDKYNSYMFQPRIPQITSKLLQLPLFDNVTPENDLYSIDQHDYYVQMKFIPNLSSISDESFNAPPLEIWCELDDNDNAILTSAQCILLMEQKRLFLESGHLPHDYRIDRDTTVNLTESFELNQENWLNDQPGLKEFFRKAKLKFGQGGKVEVPGQVKLSLPMVNSNGIDKVVDVNYDYINITYRRVLRLKYMDKYLVQFSDINGGSRGGRYTQVDFVGDGSELDSTENLRNFITDISSNF
ncbi:hypothetical protein Kpol_1036p82 [Vanderwaltozyma polyspora DSM 70294]|uniref:Uncharacterized protein n=1 Tax=Vanderwaltozyma polyspora (strain ATCC 22028 / DSM 70294 / BCRC 21397 / CBS 2163 / NBRC 10782 / NRRL Y-8283 / UCD 57-17) TaxID=436907 RepID=A7TEM9_VANPO|nr:uncharacterized protein Kpol_1036p82 [Vanderwaltozyma polyspora DSM 70294]EDO19336.1 hypothetical protein Kpol_1036p82 [Vanderwaltozyma polyspora DSM 70294]